MGLGGAEFRLPVLAGLLHYSARQAVPLNLAVSLVTIAVALVIRSHTLSINALLANQTIIFSLILGAGIAAFFGVKWSRNISNKRLEKIILFLLVLIGCALIIEGFLPKTIPALVPAISVWQMSVGVICGLVIGLVSSLLGVAGGELIIPTLMFAFGIDIKTAGTASLFISLPTVLIGLIRYIQHDAFDDRTSLKETVLPMSLGAVIGAILGGMLVGIFPASLLKIVLGIVLNFSAFRVFYHTQNNFQNKPE